MQLFSKEARLFERRRVRSVLAVLLMTVALVLAVISTLKSYSHDTSAVTSAAMDEDYESLDLAVDGPAESTEDESSVSLFEDKKRKKKKGGFKFGKIGKHFKKIGGKLKSVAKSPIVSGALQTGTGMLAQSNPAAAAALGAAGIVPSAEGTEEEPSMMDESLLLSEDKKKKKKGGFKFGKIGKHFKKIGGKLKSVAKSPIVSGALQSGAGMLAQSNPAAAAALGAAGIGPSAEEEPSSSQYELSMDAAMAGLLKDTKRAMSDDSDEMVDSQLFEDYDQSSLSQLLEDRKKKGFKFHKLGKHFKKIGGKLKGVASGALKTGAGMLAQSNPAAAAALGAAGIGPSGEQPPSLESDDSEQYSALLLSEDKKKKKKGGFKFGKIGKHFKKIGGKLKSVAKSPIVSGALQSGAGMLAQSNPAAAAALGAAGIGPSAEEEQPSLLDDNDDDDDSTALLITEDDFDDGSSLITEDGLFSKLKKHFHHKKKKSSKKSGKAKKGHNNEERELRNLAKKVLEKFYGEGGKSNVDKDSAAILAALMSSKTD